MNLRCCRVCHADGLDCLYTICHICWRKAGGSEPAAIDELLGIYQKMRKLNHYIPPYLQQVAREYHLMGLDSDPLGSLFEVEREL